VLARQEKYEDAQVLIESSFEGLEDVLGEDHQYTFIARDNLASVMSQQGRYEDAAILYKASLERRKAAQGKQDHPDTDTLLVMFNMACVLYKKGHNDEARGLCKSSYEG
jgi:tetratricopeptide (TPR) repeat protein